ncbi:MAG TPA: DUF2325 domain-containing protein [Symbiobacteriaceae bacterium]|nr:DUF2325 domain-containing protein [Symbiobacteriaceae bacterium]
MALDSLEEQIQSMEVSYLELTTEMEAIQALMREAEVELDRLRALKQTRPSGTGSAQPEASVLSGLEAAAICPEPTVLEGGCEPLQGFRVGVIGPSSREADYRRVIESLGARFGFAPSEEKLGQIDRLCNKSDGVIFITSFTSHKVEDHLAKAVRRLGVPIYHLRYRGLERLREAALELLPQMQAFRCPTAKAN